MCHLHETKLKYNDREGLKVKGKKKINQITRPTLMELLYDYQTDSKTKSITTASILAV